VELRTQPTPYNLDYLKTKQKKLGHLLEVDEATEA
jgi:GTP cyclohydrolase II